MLASSLKLYQVHVGAHSNPDCDDACQQTSQLSRFGCETHDFFTDLTTACQSHDLAESIIVRLI